MNSVEDADVVVLGAGHYGSGQVIGFLRTPELELLEDQQAGCRRGVCDGVVDGCCQDGESHTPQFG